MSIDNHIEKWRESQNWKRFHKNFGVQIVHYVEPGEVTYDDGRQRWNVYAYIYPDHPHFKNFSGPNMWQDAATAMPFHAGPSFLQWFYFADGSPASVKVGSDYHHLGDDHFSFIDSPSEAHEVFRDAEMLYDWLLAREAVK